VVHWITGLWGFAQNGAGSYFGVRDHSRRPRNILSSRSFSVHSPDNPNAATGLAAEAIDNPRCWCKICSSTTRNAFWTNFAPKHEVGVEKLIIIGGMARSGTNLVRRIIGSHSTIAIPPAEFDFLGRVARGVPLETIFSNPRLQSWGIVLDDLVAMPPPQAYLEALRRYARFNEKLHFGEKTPLNELHTNLVDQWFSNIEVKLVQMVRNPLDAAASRKKQRMNRGSSEVLSVNLDDLASYWQRSVTIGLARQFRNPERHKVVRYEDLTQKPAETTQSICDFLGVEFEEQRMLSLEDYAKNKDNSSFSPEGVEGESSGRVYRPTSRREHLRPYELRRLGELCGELAWALGYEDELFYLRKPDCAPAMLHPRAIARRLGALARRVVATS
jgi:hypothetical protein